MPRAVARAPSAPPAPPAPLDGLQQMLAEKAAERERDEQKRARIDDEVSKLMDNGVRIIPLLRARYGPASGAS